MESSDGQPLPFSDWCFVCGDGNPYGLQGRFYRDGSRTYLVVTPRREFNGYEGILHGGIAAGLLDETMGWAAALAVNRMCVTAEITVRYLARVPVERRLVVVADPVKISKRLCTVESELRESTSAAPKLTDEGDGVLARATGKFIPLSWEETVSIDAKLIYEPNMSRVFKPSTEPP